MIATEIRNVLLLADALRQPAPTSEDLNLGRMIVCGIAREARQPLDVDATSAGDLATILEAAANRAVFQAEREKQIRRQQEQN